MYNKTSDIAKWTKEIVGRNYDPKDTFTGKLKTFDDAIDEAAAWYIRNTYPTYSKVPQFIQSLRKLPFGNFVSFPAEMIRTSTNIVSIGLKEATSSDPKLRQMGLRRLLGAYVTLAGTGQAVGKISNTLTGVTTEEIEAYKRSLSAPWEKRAQIIPINKWKEGVGKAINFSYFSPYEVITKPIEAAFKQWQEGTVRGDGVGKQLFTQLFGQDGPIRTILSPFISQPIALERFTDVLPAEIGLGNRGGITKTGSKVYVDTDSDGDKVAKSFVHVLKGIEPGAVTTGRKLVQGLQQDIAKGGRPVNLQDEVLALLSGIRIINVDVPRTMEYKITDYNKKARSVTATEKFFSLQDFRQRGPNVLAEEFRKIQEEKLRVNKDFHQILKDAQIMGVDARTLKKIMRKRNISARDANFLLKGKNIPYTGYETRMKKRVKEAEEVAKDRGVEINKEYFYPKRLFKDIIRQYKKIPLMRETKTEEETTQPNIIERGLDTVKDLFSEAPIQTPPLPNTPQPIVRPVQANVDPNTNLTRTETALLSPEEQVIASRT
jgi:hypothetical protein